MSWGLFPQMSKTLSQLWSNDIPPMAQILEYLDPDNTCLLDGFDEGGSPNMLCGAKVS
jgi:hypothetical protein